jgi:hypothetical protein
VTVACVLPRTATTLAGTEGVAAGVTSFEVLLTSEFSPSPTATTVNVYVTPFVSPDTAHDVVTVVHVFASGLEVTMY